MAMYSTTLYGYQLHLLVLGTDEAFWTNWRGDDGTDDRNYTTESLGCDAILGVNRLIT